MARLDRPDSTGGGAGTGGGRTAFPKSNVKVKSNNSVSKNGLENRGIKLTPQQAKDRASELRWDKQERNMEQRFDTNAGGPRAGEKNNGTPGKKYLKKVSAISRQADKVLPIKINSNPTTRTGAGITGKNGFTVHPDFFR